MLSRPFGSSLWSARTFGTGFALILALANSGCRTQGQGVADPVKKDKPPGGAEGGEEDGDVNIGEGGPKIMGYQYFFRISEGALTGKYTDKQDNETVGRTSEIPEVKMKGKRYVLEHYPVVWENYPKSQYGYALIDFRSETPESEWWLKHNTAVVLMGYILPHWRLLAPVVGIHWEFNQIDMGQPDSPEVAKSDLRAIVAGADFRQKIWGTGTWFAMFYQGKLHLLNPAMKSTGYEAEAGFGTSFQLSFFRGDTTLGYIRQNYKGLRAASKEDDRLLKITSQYSATYLQFTIWI